MVWNPHGIPTICSDFVWNPHKNFEIWTDQKVNKFYPRKKIPTDKKVNDSCPRKKLVIPVPTKTLRFGLFKVKDFHPHEV